MQPPPERPTSPAAHPPETSTDPLHPFLPHFLAQAGIASRRACIEHVRQGRVTVNQEITTNPTTRINPEKDRVTFNGQRVQREKQRYILLHKPREYVCSLHDKHAKKLAIELINDPAAPRLFSVGRLDKDSEGLLLFTNDGDLTQRLTHPKYGIAKTYLVTVRGKTKNIDLSRLLTGIHDQGETLRAETVEWEDPANQKTLKICLREGKNREIRRMCAALNLRVTRLLRIRFGPLHLGAFRPGFWRDLTPRELAALRQSSSPATTGFSRRND